MKKVMILSLVHFAVTMFAAPVVSNVTLSQDALSRVVTVNYTLAEEAAIITCDILTNGVSIGESNLHYFAGDCNKKVQTGNHTLTWDAPKSWPNQKITDNSVTAVVKAWAMTTPPDYMVVQLVTGDVRYYPSEVALPEGTVNCRAYKTEKLAFRRCPAGNVEWRMGNLSTGNYGGGTDQKAHLVTLTNDFYIGVFPVTQEQYRLVQEEGGYTGSYTGDDRAVHPVGNVTFRSIRGGIEWPNSGHAVGDYGFLHNLRTLVGGGEFDLPLEAQWEFAARAGCGTELYNGEDLDDWQSANNLKQLGAHKTDHTTEVGLYQPNAFGLYDMLGNVFEKCLDRYVSGDNIVGVDPNVGPSDGGSGVDHVSRGGSFTSDAYRCRVCAREADPYDWPIDVYGFRVACNVTTLP